MVKVAIHPLLGVSSPRFLHHCPDLVHAFMCLPPRKTPLGRKSYYRQTSGIGQTSTSKATLQASHVPLREMMVPNAPSPSRAQRAGPCNVSPTDNSRAHHEIPKPSIRHRFSGRQLNGWDKTPQPARHVLRRAQLYQDHRRHLIILTRNHP